MDLKVVDNFLPPRIFNRLLKIVESNSFSWWWNDDTSIDPVTKKGDNLFMFSQLLFHNAKMPHGPGAHSLYPAFQVIEDFQADICPFKEVMKLKLNLYPNQGKKVVHAEHADVYEGYQRDKRIITSVFNFHTCNGSTVVKIDGKKNNISSKANRLVLFDNTWHYGITQSDIPRRIVLNINVLKQ